MPIQTCPRLNGCPFFNDKLQDMPNVTELLKRQHCLASFETCARYVVANKLGKDRVPAELFPNNMAKAKEILAE